MPQNELGPGSFITVFATRKDQRQGPSNWHPDFTLDSEDGFLALIGPDGSIIDSFESYPKQKPDIAFGKEVKTSVSR